MANTESSTVSPQDLAGCGMDKEHTLLEVLKNESGFSVGGLPAHWL